MANHTYNRTQGCPALRTGDGGIKNLMACQLLTHSSAAKLQINKQCETASRLAKQPNGLEKQNNFNTQNYNTTAPWLRKEYTTH